ncbi:hypothetical protein ENKNEFLB_01526 [Nocardioides aquaticus]|uniref:DUF222 domain-containing protein n=1 Tax=Nocardioides aquaticus TaxID=160826 RepID=A0ABX8EF71_9ACTN|nr:hypothetical protein [Nocardioides aquaticus]QVT79146.1 hypothetical protein ENKNEFLB_01526 [Nocardioides aquaticus]
MSAGRADGPDGPYGEPYEEVGSVGEEAAKLFDAFSEMFTTGRTEQAPGPQQGPQQGPQEGAGRGRWSGDGLAALAADAMGALRDADLHVATGGEDCRICPVCRAIHAVRETTPEVRSHLVTAARSLLAAGTALVDQLDQPTDPEASPPPRPARPPRPPGPGVERIDLDQHDEHDDEHDEHGAPGSQEEHR